MNIVLWIMQLLAALLYAASGVMKVFMFDQISQDVVSFGALPRQLWTALGILLPSRAVWARAGSGLGQLHKRGLSTFIGHPHRSRARDARVEAQAPARDS